MTPRDVAARLRRVAALRTLCLGLPHVPTPSELERLRRFEALVSAPATATEGDIDALAAGCRRWWREGRVDRLAALIDRLPGGLVERDRRLASFAVAARQAPG